MTNINNQKSEDTIILRCILGISLLAGMTTSANASEDFSERFEFSGFARVVGGYLDTNEADFEGYDNSLSFSQQSLIALKSDVRLTDSLNFSAQLLAHSAEDRDSGVEWLYLNYEPSYNWRFKIGRLRTPFFRYSDVIDVGFAFPWISPPPQIYSGLLFSSYEGGTATYRFNLDAVNLDIEYYQGTYSGQFDRNGEETDIDVDDIKGLIVNLNKGNFNVRASTIQSSDFFADIPEFTQFADLLEASGFANNADSLRFDGKVKGYQVNANYDTLDYFVSAEWSKIRSDLLAVPQLDALYIAAGYNFDAVQLHVTYATSETTNNLTVNEIPKGVTPFFDQLSFVYDQVTQNVPLYSLDSVTIGARWDFKYNMSLKGEITFLDGAPKEASFFTDIQDPSFDRKATLYQIGMEWVF